jgi:adenylate kinase
MPKAFIFTGRSGSGKGTQADLLQKFIAEKDATPILYVETGESFRQFIKKENYTSKLSKEVLETDRLQPSFLASYMWIEEVIKRFTGKEHLMFDGTPRSVDEAQILNGAFQFYKIEKPIIIHLNVSRDWSKRHLLSRGRSDDYLSGVEKRLDWFDSDVLPAIKYFHEHANYVFLEINGEQPVEKVHADVVAALEGAKEV